MSVVFSAFTILAPNPVNSAIAMIGCLFSVAMVYLTMGAHFAGTIQILVYAGAIMVLFLFVIMLLEKRDRESIDGVTPGKALNLFLIASLFGALTAFLSIAFPARGAVARSLPESFGTIKAVGMAIFTKHVFAFEMLSVLILVAIVGVVTLSAKDGER